MVADHVDITTSVADGILTITFDRPAKKNAITAAMYATLAEALYTAAADPAIRVVLFAGHEAIFTAGNDLEDFLKTPPTNDETPVFRFMRAISTAEKPLVAAVRGAAIGIGTTMLLHCDLVYAGRGARFAMPFAQLGLCPEIASSLLLPRMVGYHRAAEKLLLGEAFDADEAKAIGLVNEVLDDAAVLSHAQGVAAKLAALPASAIRATKWLMKADDGTAVAERIAKEGEAFRELLGSREAKEAFSAFLEKRKPDFQQFA